MPSKEFQKLLNYFPQRLCREISNVAAGCFNFEKRLSEIRLRALRGASLTLDGKNIPLGVKLSSEEISEIMRSLCKGSLYAYSESLREGYITLKNGYRVGVAGRAVTEDGEITGVGDITSLCIRISHNVEGAGDFAVHVFEKLGCQKGMLIYSPPGMGKTTMLRDTAIQLSSGINPMRVSIIDTRGELGCADIPDSCLVDILEGYPKALGIEIATRTLSPQVLICDEIGGYDEAESILAVQSCGVPLVASVHGSSLTELLSRPTVNILSLNNIFSAYIGIAKRNDGTYTYSADFV